MGKTAKDKRDIYYRKAKEEGFRARSSYKLLQVDQTFNIFEGVTKVVDLCAAPGGWTQVITKRLAEKGIDLMAEPHCVSVDLFDIKPIEGAITLRGDITRQKTVVQIQEIFKGKVDLVVSDGAPDILGDHDFDQFVQHQLVLAALNIAILLLKPGGKFVAKVFRGRDIALLFKQFKRFFKTVHCAKPRCCRNSSIESFLVAQDFKGAGELTALESTQDLLGPLNHVQNFREIYLGQSELDSDSDEDRVEFVACGEEESFDPDMNYPLSVIVGPKGPIKRPRLEQNNTAEEAGNSILFDNKTNN